MASSKLKRRPDGLYQLSVVLEENGKKRRKYFYGKTQQEAKRKMMEWQEKQAAGRNFEEVADEWQEKHWKEIRAGTQVCYNPAHKRAVEAFSGVHIRDISPLDIKRSVDLMASQRYSYQSVATYLSVLRQVFDYAVTVGDVQANPTATINVPKGLPKGKRSVPDENQLELIRSNVDHPFGLFAYMLLYTGLRRGELLALQWQDIDFATKEITVSKTVSYAETGNKPIVGPTKSEAGTRTVILMDRLIPHLWKRYGKKQEYVFGSENPLTQSVYRTSWRNYCIETGLYTMKERTSTRNGKQYIQLVKVPAVTPHQLRHAYATMLFEADIDAKDAQQQLGHSRIDVTLDTYTHIRRKRLNDIAEKLNQAE